MALGNPAVAIAEGLGEVRQERRRSAHHGVTYGHHRPLLEVAAGRDHVAAYRIAVVLAQQCAQALDGGVRRPGRNVLEVLCQQPDVLEAFVEELDDSSIAEDPRPEGLPGASTGLVLEAPEQQQDMQGPLCFHGGCQPVGEG